MAASLPSTSFVPSASGAAGPQPSHISAPSSHPALAWTSVTRTTRILGGELFGGDGNQFMIAVTGYRAGFVAVGEDCCGAPDEVVGAVWSTADGTSWTRIEPRDVFGAAVVEHVATSGRRIVAIGTSRAEPQAAEPKTLVWLSDDGLAWRRSDAAGQAFTASFRPEGIAGAPSGFVAWGRSSSGVQHLAVSADGESWTDIGFAGAYPGTVVGGVSPWRGGWVALGGQAVEQGPGIGAVKIGRAEAWYSADGVQWSAAVADGLALGQPIAGADGLLAQGAGSECGACVGPSALWHSDDGRSWQSLGLDQPMNHSYATDGVHIVRIGMDVNAPADRNESLDVSLDGAQWTSLATGLAGAQHLGLAVGSSGILLLEPVVKDGATDQVDAGVWYLPAK